MSPSPPSSEAHSNMTSDWTKRKVRVSVQPCGTPVLAGNRPQQCTSASPHLKGFELSVHVARVFKWAQCVCESDSAQSVCTLRPSWRQALALINTLMTNCMAELVRF